MWGAELVGNTDSLRTYIRYLRQKIEADPKNPRAHRGRAGHRVHVHSGTVTFALVFHTHFSRRAPYLSHCSHSHLL